MSNYKKVLKDLKEKGIRLASSEEDELLSGKEDSFYKQLRELGYYRVFDTFYKDEYQCTQIYCPAFINHEGGYEWLLFTNENNEKLYDLYLDQIDSDVYRRKEKKILEGKTLEEILEYSKNADKNKKYKTGRRYAL